MTRGVSRGREVSQLRERGGRGRRRPGGGMCCGGVNLRSRDAGIAEGVVREGVVDDDGASSKIR